MAERLLTPEQVADRLAVTAKTVRELLKRGELRGIKVGRLWRIRESDLEAFLDPTVRALETAPEDDEPLTEEEAKAIAEAKEAITAGKTRPWEQVKKDLKL